MTLTDDPTRHLYMPDRRFVAYEYATKNVDPAQESFARDAYRCFGWAIERLDRPVLPGSPARLHLKRDRAIPQRGRIKVAEQQFEHTMESIQHLERAKTTRASIVAFSVGLVGTAALAGGVFLFLSGQIFAMVVLGLVGFAGWALPYFLFTSIRANRSAALNQEIDHQYDRVYEICEEAAALLG